jgi:hypothetical protein
MPDIAAMGCVAATIPYFVVMTERPETRGGLPPCGADVLWALTATERTAKVVIRITSVFFIALEFLWKYISLDDDRDILTAIQKLTVDGQRCTVRRFFPVWLLVEFASSCGSLSLLRIGNF